jgi:hypothetical protein
MNKPLTLAAVAIFVIVAVVHLLRLLFHWSVTVAGIDIPMWSSAIALVVAAGWAVGLGVKVV